MRPECEGVPRLEQITISAHHHSTLDNIKKEKMGGRREGEAGVERVKGTVLDSEWTH